MGLVTQLTLAGRLETPLTLADLSLLAFEPMTSLLCIFLGSSQTNSGWFPSEVLLGARTPASMPCVGHQLFDPEYVPVQEVLDQLSVRVSSLNLQGVTFGMGF